jgi:hypothetical protein
MNEPQTITVEKQQHANQVGGVFNGLAMYLQSLAHENADGQLVLTEQLNDARKLVLLASFWAIQHVMVYGVPQKKSPPAPADVPPADAPLAETSADAPASRIVPSG